MSRKVRIHRARPVQAVELTEIAHHAKRHWGYPERWLKRWRRQLTIRPGWVARHPTFVATDGSQIVGFAGIRPWRRFVQLEHLWVRPEAMGRGLGRALFEHAVRAARRAGFARMRIVSDPNAEGFYRRMGARRVSVSRSRIEGRWRELPVLQCCL